MSEKMEFKINIPVDTDGFAILKCHLCGEHFKLNAVDFNAEENINIWCPYCGLLSNSYVPEDVIEIAQKIATNEMMKMIHESFKKLERSTRNNKYVKIKSEKKAKEIPIEPLQLKIDSLEIKKYECCKKQVKISPLHINIGSYCPFCGGMYE